VLRTVVLRTPERRGGKPHRYVPGQVLIAQAYASFNPVEREIRRRLLWLIAGGDKSGCVSKGQPPLLADFQYASVGLPSLMYVDSPIDRVSVVSRGMLMKSEDEYFSEEGYQHQPEGKTSILTGFFYVSKLYRRKYCSEISQRR